jgi:hypothetical protein
VIQGEQFSKPHLVRFYWSGGFLSSMSLAAHTGVEGLTTAMRRQGKEKFRPDASKKLREQVHEVMRYFHHARRTELAYWHWIERFLRFHKERAGGWRRPAELREPEVAAFLSHLAAKRMVAAATQNQALNALVFLQRRCWTSRWG